MRKVVITGGSKGIGKAIKDILPINPLCLGETYEITDFSRASGYDLTATDFPKEMNKTLYESDIFISCAGVWGWKSNNAFYLNYLYPSLVMDFLPKKCHMIFILSNAAYENFGNDDYTTAKAGLLLKARRMQKEGYRITTISPGTVNTDFWKDAEVDNRTKCIPIEPEEIAELVLLAINTPSLITELIILPRKLPCS